MTLNTSALERLMSTRFRVWTFTCIHCDTQRLLCTFFFLFQCVHHVLLVKAFLFLVSFVSCGLSVIVSLHFLLCFFWICCFQPLSVFSSSSVCWSEGLQHPNNWSHCFCHLHLFCFLSQHPVKCDFVTYSCSLVKFRHRNDLDKLINVKWKMSLILTSGFMVKHVNVNIMHTFWAPCFYFSSSISGLSHSFYFSNTTWLFSLS